MTELEVKWATCGEDRHWCNLMTLNLDSISAKSGVYVIWQPLDTGRVVYVGQGDIRDRLGKHKQDSDIIRHAIKNSLLVTWASVQRQNRKGVELFLAEYYDPLEGKSFPQTDPISVNLPGNPNT